MSALDVPRMIHAALATSQNQTKPNGDDLTMNNSTNQAMDMNQGMQQPAVQKTPLTFNCYDPSTGRTWNEDNMGRRITRRPDMTGTQLVRINSMRNQVGLPYLNEHNVKNMSIDSASLMIDDMMAIIKKYEDLRMNFGIEYKKLQEQNEVLLQQLDESLKDPKVAVELAKQRQAENMKREMKE